MTSSLAKQLAQSVSLNKALLTNRSKRSPTESYLFTSKEAVQHDLDALAALGMGAFRQLSTLNPSFEEHGEALFSGAARAVDRTLLSEADVKILNRHIRGCLELIGPYLLDSPGGKAIEWLVRRFRINEFNVDDILTLFLPYHDSPYFAKMLSILHIRENTSWAFLLPFKASAQSIPRSALVAGLLRSSDAARFVAALLPNAIRNGTLHRTLVLFNASSLHDYIAQSPTIDEGTVAFLLPALMTPIQPQADLVENPCSGEAILGTYVLLAALSQKCRLTPKALKLIVGAMAGAAYLVNTRQFVSAVIALCAPQDMLEQLARSAEKAIISMEDIGDALGAACGWTGAEKFICPFLNGICTSSSLLEENVFGLVEKILLAPKVTRSIVERVAYTLFKQMIHDEEEVNSVTESRKLLSMIYQRHPISFQNAVYALIEEDAEQQDQVEQISISLLALPKNQHISENVNDMILASYSTDFKTRIMAVRNLLTAIESAIDDDFESIQSTLYSRIYDTNPQVLEALYTSSPSILLPIIRKKLAEYLEVVKGSHGAVLRAHLSFTTTHLFGDDEATGDTLVFGLVVPMALCTKDKKDEGGDSGRGKAAIWAALGTIEGSGLGEHSLLKGCFKARGTGEGEKWMEEANLRVAEKFAENIENSKNYDAHFESLLSALRDSNAHTRVFAYLCVRALMSRLQGRRQIEAATRVLDVLGVDQRAAVEGLLNGVVGSTEVLEGRKIARNVVKKPESPHTTHLLQLSVLALVAKIPPPEGLVLNWFENSNSNEKNSSGGAQYVKLLRSIYMLLNSTRAHPRLSRSLLSDLFVTLKDDTLAFLASIWTNPSESADTVCRVLALRHAAAFLEAFKINEVEGAGVDFQTVIPSILFALTTSDPDVRAAGMKCVAILANLVATKFEKVYKFDAIYGEGSGQLQYLRQEDFKRYLAALLEHKEHILNDKEHIAILHTEHLSKLKGEKKKEADYKQRVLCYLLTHICAIPLPDVQINLLQMIAGISDKAKPQILLPIIQRLVQDSHMRELISSYGSRLDLFADLVVNSVDASCVAELNDGSELWSIYTRLLKHFLEPGAMVRPRKSIARSLEVGLFQKLSFERQVDVSEVILSIGSRNPDAHIHCKKLLGNLLNDVPLVVHLLISLQPSTIEEPPRASKRARLTDPPEDSISALCLLAEVLGAITPPPSIELITRLLETLNRVVQFASPTVDLNFVQQQIMSAIEKAADQVKDVPNLSPSAIRLEIVAELIRVANNPQTFQQALLLMANLTRLAPESILNNVMPVFTFMGSNVFHRDDSYSFKVVQKTIDCIVPVMANSLKNAYPDLLDLYIGSRDFLRIFTDASNHIPRHRRTNFFIHLTDVLGPGEFLSPVLMLLIEKLASRVTRQNLDDALPTLALPLSVLNHYKPSLQIFALTEILRESERLITRSKSPVPLQPLFLEPSSDDEHLLRRAHALVIFVGLGVKHSESPLDGPASNGDHKHLIALLVSIAAQRVDSTEGKKIDLPAGARMAMGRALAVMSARNFLSSANTMLQSEDNLVRKGALDLISERITSVSETVRSESVEEMKAIILSIGNILAHQQEGQCALSALRAIRAIASTNHQGEETVLASQLPRILALLKDGKMGGGITLVLPTLVRKLGPRIIPYFREVIQECATLLGSDNKGEKWKDVDRDCLETINSLLSVIPNFWGGPELAKIVQVYVGLYNLKAAQILLSTLCEVWTTLQTQRVTGAGNKFIGFFTLLRNSLRFASRQTVLELVRPLFDLFVGAFSFQNIAESQAEEAKSLSMKAFVEYVSKLNEAAFRPLFRKLFDWAFGSDSVHRRITFCAVYSTLLEFFKGMMNPYMSFVLGPLVDVLGSSTQPPQTELWQRVIETLTLSFINDEGTFWNEQKLRQIGPPLVRQIPVCATLNNSESNAFIQSCLVALLDCIGDDTDLKSLNLQVLMHTRSDEARTRAFALSCSEALWRAQGSRLLGFVAETATFIAECVEDENDNVVKESYKLKHAVENVAGSISGM